MAADFLVGSQPYLLLHGLYFFGFALTFLVWSGIHYAAEIGASQVVVAARTHMHTRAPHQHQHSQHHPCAVCPTSASTSTSTT